MSDSVIELCVKSGQVVLLSSRDTTETTRKKRLGRDKQCAKCPWKVTTNPHEIPNGYSEGAHCALSGTIATHLQIGGTIRVMACHESPVGKETECIGWLVNQMGPGNNVALRILMMDYDLSRVKLVGAQHPTFEDTLP